MKKSIIILILAVILPLSCTEVIPQGSTPRLVVEGWIESGGHPMVTLTESLVVEMGKDITTGDLVESLAKWARVTVSDGDTTVILTGVVDANYFPPYVFSSSKLTGEVGKTYELRVEYKDYVASARTTIPEPVPLDTVYVATVSDSLCSVACGFTDPVKKGNYYKIFTKTEGVDTHYHSSVLALLDGDPLQGYSEIALFSTQRMMDLVGAPNLFVGDNLWVKLCTMDREAFNFWKHYEVILYANMFNVESGTEMHGNVQGALGYWIGYGVDKPVRIHLEDPSAPTK